MKQNHFKRLTLDGDWTLACGYHWDFDKSIVSLDAAKSSGMKILPAKVPGNLELDIERAGECGEIFYGDNIYSMYDCENMDALYSRRFTYEPEKNTSAVLVCEGLDCFAEVFIDGELVGESDNMLIPHEFELENLSAGEHEISVRFTSAVIKARERDIPVSTQAMRYSYDSIYVRKAPHMYGWDIMCRAVSMGIWRHIYIESPPTAYIKDVYVETLNACADYADLKINYNCHIEYGDIRDYRLLISGKCGESEFSCDVNPMWHTGGNYGINLRSPKLWYPRNYGDANLYHVTAELCYKGEPVHKFELDTGVRSVILDRTSTTDKDGHGQFRFIVNGKPVFALGTNWVPVDAYHSRDEERLDMILPMLADIGCNTVRCWGGNVYENEKFYDFCDKNGIMVWQDFAMACAVYPQDDEFAKAIGEEAEIIIKALRHHPSIVLWAGDNECDAAHAWNSHPTDPNDNILTRKILPEKVRAHSTFTPYLPSSPYIDEEAYKSGKPTSEDHLWGLRDYFKGDYYKNTVCHFASETGYHGCPSPESLKKFIPKEHLWGCLDDRYWICHAACMTPDPSDPFYYRIRLMWNQVVTLFGEGSIALSDLEHFSRASQISQAEAKKYFIERFRLTKWRRTGIIWWNLIDGWPQISDAVVDYYGDKKLAYYYIKQSQKPVQMMFDEQCTELCDGKLNLYAVNDTREDKTLAYTVENDCGEIVTSGKAFAKSDTSALVCSIPASEEKRYCIIRWKDENGEEGVNHYFENIRGIDYGYYETLLEKLGL